MAEIRVFMRVLAIFLSWFWVLKTVKIVSIFAKIAIFLAHNGTQMAHCAIGVAGCVPWGGTQVCSGVALHAVDLLGGFFQHTVGDVLVDVGGDGDGRMAHKVLGGFDIHVPFCQDGAVGMAQVIGGKIAIDNGG